MKNTHTPFFEKGLQFECLRCGKCCSGFPGYVYLSEKDIDELVDFLHLNWRSFLKKYTRLVHVFNEPRLSLVEKARHGCVFWDTLCTVYPARPVQCRTYPFWKRHLVSQWEWKRIAGFCPGVNRGRVHSKDEIYRLMNQVPDYNLSHFSRELLSKSPLV